MAEARIPPHAPMVETDGAASAALSATVELDELNNVDGGLTLDMDELDVDGGLTLDVDEPDDVDGGLTLDVDELDNVDRGLTLDMDDDDGGLSDSLDVDADGMSSASSAEPCYALRSGVPVLGGEVHGLHFSHSLTAFTRSITNALTHKLISADGKVLLSMNAASHSVTQLMRSCILSTLA
jgi:hypothetical protein